MFGRLPNLIGRPKRLNTLFRWLIPVAESDRRLAGINCFSGRGPASSLPEQVMRHAA